MSDNINVKPHNDQAVELNIKNITEMASQKYYMDQSIKEFMSALESFQSLVNKRDKELMSTNVIIKKEVIDIADLVE